MGSLGQVEVAETTQSNRGRREENKGQRTGNTGQREEARGQKTEDRQKRTEDRGQRTQGTKQITIKMCIPTRVVGPTVTSTAGFLRTNITRINKVRPTPPLPQNVTQPRNFATFKTNTNHVNPRMNSKETPACPVVTYASIVSIFTLILYSNVQHGVRWFQPSPRGSMSPLQ